jgi:hypothetical protein
MKAAARDLIPAWASAEHCNPKAARRSHDNLTLTTQSEFGVTPSIDVSLSQDRQTAPSGAKEV